jgi:ATP-dependent DNA helicase RecG
MPTFDWIEKDAVIRHHKDVYLRVANTNRGPLNRDEVKSLEYNQTIRSFEDEVRKDFDPNDFDRSKPSLISNAVWGELKSHRWR